MASQTTDFPFTILQLVPRLGAGGAERSTVEIAGAIIRAGGRALVVSAGGRLAAEITAMGGVVIEMPIHRKDPVSIIANGRRIAALIKREGVDIVHARSRAPAWAGLMASRQTGAPMVATFHGIHRATNPFKRFYNSGLLRGDRVIANSQFTASRIVMDYKIAAERLTVIPRGADLERFDPENISGECLDMSRNSLKINNKNESGFVFLLPARLTAWKGQREAVAAFARLKEKVSAGKLPPLRLIICGGAQGDRGYEEALRTDIEERGVREMVTMAGDIADMPAAYAVADAVLAPSLRAEPFGRVAVEAAAMGVPVIASNDGGYRETILHNETGLLVEPGNEAALADACAQLVTAPALCSDMGRKAQARARKYFSSDAMGAATLGVYKEILSERG